MLLCSHHHRLVHEGGFRIERDYQDHWFFKRVDGRAMPSCAYQAQDIIDDDTGDNISEFSSVINNPSAEGFLAAVNTARPTSVSAICDRTESVAMSCGE